jgi:hypothetical protein
MERLETYARQLEQERDRLMEHLDEIRQGRVMRLLNAVDDFRARLRGRGSDPQ